MSRFREFMKSQQHIRFSMGSFVLGMNSGLLFVVIADGGPIWAVFAYLALIIICIKVLRAE